MAWSDAARAAALEARRHTRHIYSAVKADVMHHTPQKGWAKYVHSSMRKQLASKLKAFRAIMRHAVTSTFYRNRTRYKYGKDAT